MTFADTTSSTINGNAELGTVAPEASPDAAKAKDISLAIDDAKKGELRVQVMGTAAAKARVARAAEVAATTPITTLKASDFTVTVDNSPVENIQSAYDMSERCYVLTSTSVTDWTKVQNVTVSVGEASETVKKMDTTVKIEFADPTNTTYTIGTEIPEGGFEFGTLKLTNLFTSDVQVKEIKKNGSAENDLTKITIGADGKVYLAKALFDGLTNSQTVTFKLTDGTTDTSEFTVTAKNAPALTDALNAVQTAGVEKVTGQAAVYTGKFTAAAASETINLTVKAKALFDGLTNSQTVTFKLTDGTTDTSEFTVTAKNAPALTDALNAVQTAGNKVVNEVKATATYAVTKSTQNTAAVIVKGADSFQQEVSVTLADADNSNAAQSIRDALSQDVNVKGKYDITGATDKIILTAKSGIAGENVTLEVKGSDASKLTLGGATDTQQGVAAKPAKAGTLTFTVPAGGTENASYKLKMLATN